jgi:tetratricopeptide (TPR) repeat protein
MQSKSLQRSDTKSWGAFHLATEALRDIDRFVFSSAKDLRVLEEAREKLQGAVQRDPNFNRAWYYAAIVDDMLGNSTEAVRELEELLAKNPTFKDEAEYNLAVSYYHRYYREHIVEALRLFQKVIGESADLVLKYMARAGLVRSFSMMVLHSIGGSDESGAAEFFDKAKKESGVLLEELATDTSVDQRTKQEITWRVLNGRGVGFMFASDLQKDPGSRRRQLHEALKDFREADKRSRDNWEIVCNLGSVHMRLGYTYKVGGSTGDAKKEFDVAKCYIRDVMDRIRPNYGFALYELGRIYRVEGDFSEARRWLDKAKMIPEKDRNVSDKTIAKQVERANQSDSTL